MSNYRFGHVRKAVLRGGVSLLTLGLFAASGAAYAQSTSDNGAVETVVVTGFRASLVSAESIKKNADTILDSITAQDIGVFPDKSVSDALQRVPGITVSRLQSSDDTTHPSGEPTTVLVRGLTQVRTELNGRDSFSADADRGLNFNDVAPEMMTAIDTYKNQTADMIEGGIAGTVNLRTRLPFDVDDHVLALSVKGNYNDRSDSGTFDYSGIAGKNIDTSFGRFGLLIGYSNSHVVTQTNSEVMMRTGTFCSAGAVGANGDAIVAGNGSIGCTASPYGGSSWQYLPDEVNFSKVNYNRKREGESLAFQYSDPSDNFRVTAQYNDFAYRNAWLEHSANFDFFGLWAAPGFNPMSSTPILPAAGTPNFTFNPNGTLKSGVITSSYYSSGWAASWAGSYPQAVNDASVVPGVPYVNYCGAGYTCATSGMNGQPTAGIQLEDQARVFDHSEATRNYSINMQWDVNDNLHASFDGSYVNARTGNNDMLVADDIQVNAQYQRDGNGPPSIKVLPGDNINYAPGFQSNLANYYSDFVQDHMEDNNAKETAVRGDIDYDVDNGWLKAIKFGVRYAARDQFVRYSAYNWNSVVATWICNGPSFSLANTSPAAYPAGCGGSYGSDPNFRGYGKNIWTTDSFSGFYNGKVLSTGSMFFLNNQTLENWGQVAQALDEKSTGSSTGWTPLCDRSGNTTGCFQPSELLNVSEKTTAGYVMADFGGDDLALLGIPVSGNVGVRYVKTELTSSGGISYPTSNWYTGAASGAACNTPVGGTNVTNITCWLTPDLLNFSNAASGTASYGKTNFNLLPSANVRFDLTDRQVLRFAVSEGLSRPDFGYLRNYVQISSPAIDVSNTSQYVVYNSPGAAHTAANVTGYNFVFTAQSGNPALKPETAWNYDASYEYYFSKSSMFSADLFLKELSNTISYGEAARNFTNNGSTETVYVMGPVNNKNGGELWGFELNYQAFFDFLPAPFDGLGAQLNYTHTHEAGIHNSNLAVEPGYTAGSTIGFGGGLQIDNAIIDSHRLAGISDDAYNVVAMYEKGPIGMRLAYNWRSRFLTDNLDCCIGLPMYQKAAGFLDGSIRYDLNEHLQVSLDASNLLDTPIIFQQQVFGDTSLSPKAKPTLLDTAWSKSGRLFQLALRLKY
ncbi:MAG: TonB-dependent receptor [Alphaproteobacteria bacterium]|nr:TonB-dependent receptor [Alphaproteobacteria bacterium]MDE2110090.1 TonB-dependent receptor [Alphaproteobacteria bacterium]MDE2495116.1 TonB-dependent receptor [Alphaproteobacteria bacterium]